MSRDLLPPFRRDAFLRMTLIVALGLLLWGSPRPAEAQIGGRVVPGPGYFVTLQGNFDRGDYVRALQGFQGEWNSGMKNGQTRWVDSVAFHAMQGECYYQQGNHVLALEQFNAACNLWNFHSTWMMNVEWTSPRPNPQGATAAPWGKSTRQTQYATYQDTYSVKQGNIDNSNVVRNGGVVQLAVKYPVNVIEICRTVTLASRRRREILGPLAPFDKVSGELVLALSGPSTPPGSWSQCFVDVMHGCALSAAGKDQAAKGVLERGLVANGQFDHPLTATALFELGRIELSAGNYLQAAGRFEEATYAAYQWRDPHLLEESFRYFALAHIMNGKPGQFGTALAAAMGWARTGAKSEPLYAGLATLSAEAFSLAGDVRSAATAVGVGTTAMARNSLGGSKAGARLNYIAAQIAYQQGDVGTGDQALARALAFQSGGSVWVFQIALTDEWFRSGLIGRREAFDLYRMVLREPTSADWLSNPMESITTLLTPHSAQLETWFHIAMERKEYEAAIDISDMLRRHRFFNSQSIGGRLLSLRWVLDGPEDTLPKEVRTQRQDILASFAGYDAAKKEAEALRTKIEQSPLISDNTESLNTQGRLFDQYMAATSRQEAILKEISLRRTPCDMVFPPRRRVEDVQKALGPKQACVAYIMAADQLYACFIGEKMLSITEIRRPTGGRGSVFGNVEALLKEWGQINAQRQINSSTLTESKWVAIAEELTKQLLRSERTDFPKGYDELVIIPEGPLWYLPFEVLGVSSKTDDSPLVTKVRIRYAPTLGLTIPDGRRRRPLPATLLAVGKIYAQDKSGLTEAAAEDFVKVVPRTLPIDVKTPLPGNAAAFTSFIDRLVVYDDVPTGNSGPFSWSPLPWMRGTHGGDMFSLLSLPWIGPSQVILPGFHSAAEGQAGSAVGNDLFLASCGLMAAGADTVVLTRWRSGGQKSFDIVREFCSEVDHTTPADAWQRAVLLAMDGDVDLTKEPRIAAGANAAAPPASHPFFWAGGMLFDSGDSLTADAAQPVEQGALAKLKEKQRLLEEAQRRQKEQQSGAAPVPVPEKKPMPEAQPAPDGAPAGDATPRPTRPERKPRERKPAVERKPDADAPASGGSNR